MNLHCPPVTVSHYVFFHGFINSKAQRDDREGDDMQERLCVILPEPSELPGRPDIESLLRKACISHNY